MSTGREMTLAEYMAVLPSCHRARKEYEALVEPKPKCALCLKNEVHMATECVDVEPAAKPAARPCDHKFTAEGVCPECGACIAQISSPPSSCSPGVREALEKIIALDKAHCEILCKEIWYPYGRHAPECSRQECGEIAAEALSALPRYERRDCRCDMGTIDLGVGIRAKCSVCNGHGSVYVLARGKA